MKETSARNGVVVSLRPEQMHHNLLLLQLLFIPSTDDGSDRETKWWESRSPTRAGRPAAGRLGAPAASLPDDRPPETCA